MNVRMPIDRKLDPIKRRRMRLAERKLQEAQRQLARTERSILYWSSGPNFPIAGDTLGTANGRGEIVYGG